MLSGSRRAGAAGIPDDEFGLEDDTLRRSIGILDATNEGRGSLTAHLVTRDSSHQNLRTNQAHLLDVFIADEGEVDPDLT